MRMQQAASKVRDPDVQVTAAGEGARVIHLSGAWDIRALESRVGALQSALRDAARLPETERWHNDQSEKRKQQSLSRRKHRVVQKLQRYLNTTICAGHRKSK